MRRILNSKENISPSKIVHMDAGHPQIHGRRQINGGRLNKIVKKPRTVDFETSKESDTTRNIKEGNYNQISLVNAFHGNDHNFRRKHTNKRKYSLIIRHAYLDFILSMGLVTDTMDGKPSKVKVSRSKSQNHISPKDKETAPHLLVWTDWSDWSECSASCGKGFQKRERRCLIPSLKTCREDQKRILNRICKGLVKCPSEEFLGI
uniref:Uncharacterized protein n=1 Tax=Timema cristinae TaxID=61476 RepID=A0A7R9DG07_TIMCR|nr:unnamed protein product [Timema cristinae]